jgi:hypothetical protein
MDIEDFIVHLAFNRTAVLNAWDQKLVHSFADQIGRGLGFTEKQGNLALKILKRHSSSLSSTLNRDITQYLINPTYRYPFRQINSLKKFTVIDDATYGKVIKVEFPYNEDYVTEIRKNRDNLGFAQWDKDEKAWMFDLSENSIRFLSNLMVKEQFVCDDEFQNYVNQFKEIHNNLDKYVPMLVLENNELKLVNISKNTPILKSKDILSAVFEARKYGVVIWDMEVSNFIESDKVHHITRDLLKTEPGENFSINSEKVEISEIQQIVEYMSPCLIVVPGGSELEKTEMSYNFLSSMGIRNDEISVMFRLPSTTHKKFNDFVKNNNLNNSISSDTKVVFVSSKMPKPVLKSKIKFNLVINLGFGNVHYTMRDFVGKHENLIFYSPATKQKELEFVYV